MSETPEMTERRLAEEKALAETPKVPTIKISKAHWKFLSKRQGRDTKLKIIQNNKPKTPPIWERRGQTFEEYQKRTPREAA